MTARAEIRDLVRSAADNMSDIGWWNWTWDFGCYHVTVYVEGPAVDIASVAAATWDAAGEAERGGQCEHCLTREAFVSHVERQYDSFLLDVRDACDTAQRVALEICDLLDSGSEDFDEMLRLAELARSAEAEFGDSPDWDPVVHRIQQEIGE